MESKISHKNKKAMLRFLEVMREIMNSTGRKREKITPSVRF